jgi:hypothetical protein
MRIHEIVGWSENARSAQTYTTSMLEQVKGDQSSVGKESNHWIRLWLEETKTLGIDYIMRSFL